jgi:hypothetical protein
MRYIKTITNYANKKQGFRQNRIVEVTEKILKFFPDSLVKLNFIQAFIKKIFNLRTFDMF